MLIMMSGDNQRVHAKSDKTCQKACCYCIMHALHACRSHESEKSMQTRQIAMMHAVMHATMHALYALLLLSLPGRHAWFYYFSVAVAPVTLRPCVYMRKLIETLLYITPYLVHYGYTACSLLTVLAQQTQILGDNVYRCVTRC